MKTLTTLVLMLFITTANFAQTTFTATTAYDGTYGTGDYTVFSTATSTLTGVDKPIILVEDFDPLNLYSPYAIAQGFNSSVGNYIGSQLMNLGYDIVVLNFSNGGDDIQRNAYLLEKLISLVNTNKTGSNSLVVCGIGMGGLVARYALAHMEQSSVAHNVSLYVSYDAPHKGANVPVSLQWLIKRLSFGITVSPEFDLGLSTPAAKQMFLHYNSGQNARIRPDAKFNSFYAELNALNTTGWPNNLRKIAISNGAKDNSHQNGVGEGEIGVRFMMGDPSFPIMLGWSNTLSYHVGEDVVLGSFFSLGQGQGFFALDVLDNDFQDGVDNSPGGNADYYNMAATQVFDQFIDVETTGTKSKTCFVPTLSALAITSSSDWVMYNTVGDNDIMCHTPFDAIYAPINNNFDHLSIQTLASNWLYDQIVNTSTSWQLNSNGFTYAYNFGGNTSDILFKSVQINANAKLGINCAQYVDDVNKNSTYGNLASAPIPAANSNFQLNTACGKPIIISNETNGEITIGDGSGRVGVLNVQSGSILRLKSNSLLKINNNSKVIIGNGGTLVFEAGANINLVGANSILQIGNGGKIQIGTNATFTVTGEGYLLFEDNSPAKYNITTAGTNAKFFLDGSSATASTTGYRRKVIEVVGNEALYPSDYLTSFEIKNAIVILNQNTRVIAGCPIKLFNVDFLPNPLYPNLKHRGLHLFGQKTDLSVVKVVRAQKGITAYNNYGGNDLNLTAYTAIFCDQGLWVNDKGVNIFSGTFTSNSQQAMFLNAQSRPSELNSITAMQNLSGADVIGNKGALAKFVFPNIQFNGSGIYADNSTISAQCGSIRNSNNYNVYLKNNSLLDMDPAHILNAGLIDFSTSSSYSTPYLIRLDKAAHGPYLNNAKSNFLSSNWRIWGDLRDISSLFGFAYMPITVDKNYWPPSTAGVTLPIFNSHYRVRFISRSFPSNIPTTRDLTYTDNTPLSAAPNTSSCNPFNNPYMSIFNGVRDKYTSDGRNVKDLLKSGVDKIYDSPQNVSGAVQDFKDILAVSYSTEDLTEWTIPLMYTFDKLYEAIARGLQDNTYLEVNEDGTTPEIYTSVITLYNTWITINSEDSKLKYTLKFNKALFSRLFNKRTSCLAQLNCLTSTADEDDMPLLQYYKCVVDKEIKMTTGEVAREEYNVFDECVTLLQMPSDRTIPTDDGSMNKRKLINENQQQSFNSLAIFNMYPNPATNQLYLAFNSLGKDYVNVEIYDLLGKKLIEIEKLAEKDNNITIDLQNLSAGTYILKMHVDGIVKTEKFIVAK